MGQEEQIRVRRLKRDEHGRTRALWEEIFSEDSPAFLDYYYTQMADHNEIYAIEDCRRLQAMLQLNPYQIQAGTYLGKMNYIVAVATKESCRGRGYMTALLKEACRAMYREGMPFTFLMPAAEAIYYPHGFRFIYRQKQGTVVSGQKAPYLECIPAEESDCVEAAAFAERLLKNEKASVYAKRDVFYYKRIRREQISENGGLLMLRENGVLKGLVYFASEGEEWELREPLLETAEGNQKEWLSQAAYQLCKKEGCRMHCEGFGTEPEKPVIMARVVCLEAFFGCFMAKEDLEGDIRVSDAILPENEGRWHLSAKKGQPISASREILIRAAALEGEEKREKKPIPVSVLMSVLSGYLSIEELERAEESRIPAEAKSLLQKIKPWNKIVLNEIV